MRVAVIAFAFVLSLAAVPGLAVDLALDVTLDGSNVLDGEADQQLESIGRRAAEEGLALEVRAPDLWKSHVLEPIRNGIGKAQVNIEFVNALSREVQIRGVPADQAEDPMDTLKRITSDARAHAAGLDDGEEASAPAPQAAPDASASPGAERPDVQRPDLAVPEVRVERPRAALPDVRQAARDSISDSAGGEGASAAASPGPTEDEEPPAQSNSSADLAAAERARFEGLYNDGRGIDDRLTPAELEKGDLVFTGDYVNVVVRRGISTRAYWLDGAPPMERLQHDERNRFTVVANAHPQAAHEPAPAGPGDTGERDRLERLYNAGRDIDETLGASDLRPDDRIYAGKGVNVVVRKAAIGRRAFWLAPDVDLDQPGIQHQTRNRYEVIGAVR